MTWHAKLSLSIATFVLAASAEQLPAQQYTPPEGCRLDVTVQNRSCSVSQIYSCESDPDGYYHIAMSDGGNGGAEELYDENGALVEYQVEIPEQDVDFAMTYIDEPTARRFDFKQLKENKTIPLDFRARQEVNGDAQEIIRTMGLATVEDESLMIDDVEMITIKTQTTKIPVSYQEMLSGEFSPFYEAVSFHDAESGMHYGYRVETLEYKAFSNMDYTPVQILSEGDEGFGSRLPVHDCGSKAGSNNVSE